MSEKGPPGSAASRRPYGGRSPDDRRADRTRRILDAALELYGTDGYSPTTISQLCRTAGVAPVKFYEEFASQEDVLLLLCEERVLVAFDAVNAAVDAAEPEIDAVARAGLGAFCHALLDDPRVAQVLLIEIVGVSREVERHRRAIARRYAELILRFYAMVCEARGETTPDIDSPQNALVATALVGAVMEAIVGRVLDENRMPIDELVEILANLFLLATALIATTH